MTVTSPKSLLAALGAALLATSSAMSVAAAAEGRMTPQGTPRADTLIVDALDGRSATPTQFNPYLQGVIWNSGIHNLCYTNLFENDGTKGEMVPWLAEKHAEPLNADSTKWRVTLRKGMTWGDGVEFTTDDVVYTMNMLLNTPALPDNGYWKPLVKSITPVDKYVFDVELTQPYTRFEQLMGNPVWDTHFHILAKHIWEKEDPTKFQNSNPVCLDAWSFVKADPNGYWHLWKRRDDWKNTPTGAVLGKPQPEYVLFEYYGPEEKRILAGMKHDLDLFVDVSPEGWDVLRQRDKYAKTWLPTFPYANMDDPCTRGIAFNDTNPPYDKKEVRWALALATDAQSLSLGTYGGKLRFSPLQVPALSNLQPVYHFPLEPWLKDFALDDGFKPFNPDAASGLVKTLTESGQGDLPTDTKKQQELFGVGWWKYAPDQAAKLLEGVGFKKDSNGQWLLPDGSPWKMTINVPANFEPESARLGYAVADAWKKFGVDAVAQPLESGPFWAAFSVGKFDAGSYWPGCGLNPDVYYDLNGYHERNFAPTGQPGSSQEAEVRYRNPKVSALIDEMAALKTDDPKVVDLTKDVVKIFVQDMPWIPMFGTSKFVPVETYYFKGAPDSSNPYFGPWWWWANFRFVLPKLQPTGNM